MNKKRIGIFITLVAVVCLGLNAQRATSLKINEVLVTNEQNYQDDYGLHNAWIEIFNTSFASVNIEGCYLTNDKDNPTKYPIPKGDVLTLIKPRQHILFWADGMPNRGTFHVSFTLDPSKENYIALYPILEKHPSGYIEISDSALPCTIRTVRHLLTKLQYLPECLPISLMHEKRMEVQIG